MAGNKTRVWKSRGQYLVTVPKALAEAMGLADTCFVWELAGRDRLRVKVVRETREEEKQEVGDGGRDNGQV